MSLYFKELPLFFILNVVQSFDQLGIIIPLMRRFDNFGLQNFLVQTYELPNGNRLFLSSLCLLSLLGIPVLEQQNFLIDGLFKFLVE
jgi:hypothetical protein